MAAAPEHQPNDVPQCWLDLDLRLYQPDRDAQPIHNTGMIYYKLPTYAVIFIPSTEEIAILNKKHLSPLNRDLYDRLKPEVLLANATFYPVVGYDKNLHGLRLLCCDGIPVENRTKTCEYMARTNPGWAIRNIEKDAAAHFAECCECSGSDQCDEGRYWLDALAVIDKDPQLRELRANGMHEALPPEAVLRRRYQPGTEGIRENQPAEQQARPAKADEPSSGPPTGKDGLDLRFLWLSRIALVLTLAHGATRVVLAVSEALEVKLGMLEYAQLFEAGMTVESLYALRKGKAMFYYPFTLAADVVLRIVILAANFHKGKPIGREDIVSCAVYVAVYCVLLGVLGLRHLALRLVRKRDESSNHNGNHDGSP